MGSERISLAWELAELAAAMDAAQLLVDAHRHGQLAEAEEERVAPRAASAVLSLARQRTALLMGATQGTVDPRRVLGRHNHVGEEEAGDVEDVLLSAWSDGERLRRLRDEVRRLERRASRERDDVAHEKEDP